MNDTTKPETTAVAAAPKIQLAPVSDDSEFAQLLDSDRFAQIQRVAKLFSESDLVPAIFQGKPANCAVALQMAFRMKIDPMMLMQNMYIIKGRPGIEAKLAIALMNSRGPFAGPLEWEQGGEGVTRFWTCKAIHRASQRTCEAIVTWKMVDAEGWSRKDGSKWLTIPDLMGRYRSAMFLGRLYCPEVLLGLPSREELDDFAPEQVITGERVDRPAVRMPQAKSIGTGAPLPDLGTTISATEPTAPPVEQGVMVNSQTGEILGEVSEVKFVPEPAENGPLASDLAGDVPTPPEAKPEPPTAPNAAMSKPASDAQKRAIENTAKRLGLSASQVDEIVADATGFNLASLPQGAVNAALQALANRK